MKTVTICGSMRYAGEMKQIAFDLETRHGWNVLQCVYDPQKGAITDLQRQSLADAHFQKIELSDAIYVVDIDHYIGESVKKEIAYAQENGKEILFHSHFTATGKG
ncbi:MAG: hypothetical protein Q4D50_06065 [Eubacteriales bacterium]|nr:hypothetical protein [Eubacteriales bacterium]